MDRLIYHVDVNSAYLSWEAAEQLKNGAETDIREIPAIIGGDTSRRKGVVLAKSLPAKACGVRTGEPVTDALKKCPDLKSFPPNFPLYKKYSRAFIGILRQYAPVVEQVSIDEAYLDMSGLHFFYKNAEEAAQAIRKEIREQLGFTVNIGISSNKLLAKMASDFEKPDKIHTLFLEEIRDKMWPLPVRELFLTGASAAAKLKELGIETIGDLAGSDPVFLKAHLKTQGETLWRYANGMEDSPVKGEKEEAKGYGNSTTLGKDVTEYEEAARIFLYLCDTVARRLRRDGLFARTVEVEVKDCHFKRHSHQRVLDYSTNTSGELHQICCRLFKELWDGTPLRLLGVRCTKLTEENLRPQMEQAVVPNLHIYENKASGQMMMDFGERDAALAEQKNRKRLEQERKHQKLARMDEALDKIKEKYGEDSIGRAGRFFLEK